MKKLIFTVLVAAASSFSFSPSLAHHSYAGVFDMKSVTQIQGRVTKLELLNPHTSLHLNVINEQGEVEQWVLEGPGRLSLARRGWSDNMFEENELITVHGNPSLQGKKALWLDRVIRANGEEFVDPLVADDQAIEDERRARILKAQKELEN